MRKGCTIAVLLVAFLVAIPASAQEQGPSQEKTDSIRQLLKMVGAEQIQQNMLDQIMTALKPILAGSASNDARRQRAMDRMSQLMSEELKRADFTALAIELYDKYFTDEELKGLIRFYESPLGQKTLKALPTLTQESFARGMQLGQAAAQKAMERLTIEFPELKQPLTPGR